MCLLVFQKKVGVRLSVPVTLEQLITQKKAEVKIRLPPDLHYELVCHSLTQSLPSHRPKPRGQCKAKRQTF